MVVEQLEDDDAFLPKFGLWREFVVRILFQFQIMFIQILKPLVFIGGKMLYPHQ
jgi:hypothetical protein